MSDVLTKNMFLTYGMTSLNDIPESAWSSLSGNFEILCFKETPSNFQVKLTVDTLYDESNQRYAGSGKIRVDEAQLPEGVKQIVVQAMYENTVFSVTHNGVDLGVVAPGNTVDVPGAGLVEVFAELTDGTLDAVSLAWM